MRVYESIDRAYAHLIVVVSLPFLFPSTHSERFGDIVNKLKVHFPFLYTPDKMSFLLL